MLEFEFVDFQWMRADKILKVVRIRQLKPRPKEYDNSTGHTNNPKDNYPNPGKFDYYFYQKTL